MKFIPVHFKKAGEHIAALAKQNKTVFRLQFRCLQAVSMIKHYADKGYNLFKPKV